MSTAIISLLALVVIVVVSCVYTSLNPGLLALLAAILIGTYFEDLSLGTILASYPIQLFLLLVMMSLVFGVANENNTLKNLTERAVQLINGNARLLPILFFLLAFLFSAMGPGNITAVALLAPLTMMMASKQKISPLLTAIMICTGANAGAFSPFAPTGVVATGLMKQIDVDSNLIWVVFGGSALLQTFSAFAAYGLYLFRNKNTVYPKLKTSIELNPWDKKQIATLAVIVFLLIGVMLFKIPLLTMATVCAVIMFAMKLGEEESALNHVPWSTITMVTGIAVLIGLVEKTGGLDLATSFIARTTDRGIINGVLAFTTGVVSAFSSSSGVVMPAFIPLLPGLVSKMGLSNIVPLVVSVAVGSHMVDVSPLSTLGALSIAALPDKRMRNYVFRNLLIWGLLMSVVAGFLAFIFMDRGGSTLW